MMYFPLKAQILLEGYKGMLQKLPTVGTTPYPHVSGIMFLVSGLITSFLS